MRDSKGHTHAIASSKLHINVLFLNFMYEYIIPYFRMQLQTYKWPRENEFFFQYRSSKNTNSMWSSPYQIFIFFTILVKRGRKKRKKKKKIGKQGNRTISFDDTIDTLSLFPRPTQNLEDIFWLVLIHRSNHFHIIL